MQTTDPNIESFLRLEWMQCPECHEWVKTLPTEGISGQMLRYGDCGHTFWMDMDSKPQYTKPKGLSQ